MYRTGDYVYPEDLPHRFLCRVSETERFSVRDGSCQILKLAPLEGPWPEGTFLIRLDKAVRRAAVQERAALGRVEPRRARQTQTPSGHGAVA